MTAFSKDFAASTVGNNAQYRTAIRNSPLIMEEFASLVESSIDKSTAFMADLQAHARHLHQPQSVQLCEGMDGLLDLEDISFLPTVRSVARSKG